MDFEFIYDYKSKRYSVGVAGEQAALGEFLTIETNGSENGQGFIEDLLHKLELGKDLHLMLQQWTIDVVHGDVTVTHHSLISSDIDQDIEPLNDWQLRSECGVEDFIELVSQWLDFLQTK